MMEQGNSEYRRFDVPPIDINRMTCCLNAIIEVFDLHEHKLDAVDIQLIADNVKKIARYKFSLTSIPFTSILIQDIIDRKCKDKTDAQKVMELCDEKLHYFLKTRVLI